MTKTVMYVYLGTNGTICSPIHLEDIYYVRKLRLSADPDMLLTKDGINFTHNILIPENELELWREVPNGQN